MTGAPLSPDLAAFRPLGLDDLNARAAMLERLDQKYIVPLARLMPVLHGLRDAFDALEIDGARAFSYRTHYFDDAQARAYHDHHQGRRKRCKVRIRHYEDADMTWLEVKLKDNRDVTVKRRLRLPAGQRALDDTCRDFVEAMWRDQYGTPFGLDLHEVLAMRYRRATLVARAGGERMTLDSGLTFWSGLCEAAPENGLVIVETKSARGNGLADAAFRAAHVHPMARVSKYCVGLAALNRVTRRNRFLPALRRLGLLPAADAASRIAARPTPAHALPGAVT